MLLFAAAVVRLAAGFAVRAATVFAATFFVAVFAVRVGDFVRLDFAATAVLTVRDFVFETPVLEVFVALAFTRGFATEFVARFARLAGLDAEVEVAVFLAVVAAFVRLAVPVFATELAPVAFRVVDPAVRFVVPLRATELVPAARLVDVARFAVVLRATELAPEALFVPDVVVRLAVAVRDAVFAGVLFVVRDVDDARAVLAALLAAAVFGARTEFVVLVRAVFAAAFLFTPTTPFAVAPRLRLLVPTATPFLSARAAATATPPASSMARLAAPLGSPLPTDSGLSGP